MMHKKEFAEKLVHVRLSRLSQEPDLGILILTTDTGVRKFSVDAMRAELLLDELLAYFDAPCPR
ncbi:hypothetical protein E2F50_20790 [Rhizobium deserti]|uniref:Uncharacterized protein n=1 Tax=Rhizobium deserti TaxID=2547961 RepID=A0A4R5U9U2_9HYPH|nr:hypothetical protein [Rhizobium deserti]TDK31371.1 hypothetical protein E2F50_20790 [Rhizobium deserti]